MTQHLLQIHIGPMQTFIAAARRTRDLWFGSWLMSELSKAAAASIVAQNKENQLIFPAPLNEGDLDPDSGLGVSNKIAALVANPGKAAKAARTALNDRYDKLIADVSLQDKLETAAWLRAEKQLHSFLEFYWVSYPLNDNYSNARAYADALLAARKNSRNFKPVSWGGTGLPKSSLNGRMETVIPPKLGTQKMYKQFRARPGEQLSGVDLLKRLGMAEDKKISRFPSTSHMAAMPLKARLQAKANDPDVKRKWNAYIRALTEKNPEIEKQEIVHHDLELPILGRLDGALLFESRLLDFMDKSEISMPKKKLNAFLQAVEINESFPYYALLVGDGDGMGKAINTLHTADAHRDFSHKLAAFSEAARDIVKKKDGAVVYAGGDDVLALLPLHTAVSTTAALAEKFKLQMAGFKNKKDKPLTFSAGIAIVHHLEPLEDALELARKAEKEAKAYQKEEEENQKSKKDALAVVLNKRSGAPRMIVGRWGEIDGRLQKFTDYYSKKDLPHGLPYQLRDMFLHLGGQTAVKEAIRKNDDTLLQIIANEAARIIKRKEGDEKAADYVVTAVQDLDHDKNTIETLSNELIIAAHIAQAQDIAQEEEII